MYVSSDSAMLFKVRRRPDHLRISNREMDVLRLIGREMTLTDIASHLFISKHTVISHRRNLLAKFGAKNTAGLVRKAFEYGFFRLENVGQTPRINPESKLSQAS